MNKFPLFEDDGVAEWQMSDVQKKYLLDVTRKIRTGQYEFIENQCLCERTEPRDLTISRKDRFGLPVDIVMCQNCGLLRNVKVFSQKSCAQFYMEDYHGLVFGEKIPPRTYFNEQNSRGYRFYEILQPHLEKIGKASIIEIGAGCGGVLYPFQRRGHLCIGYEINENYMQYGRTRGLDLRHTSTLENFPDGSADVVILSHILEHVSNPHELLGVAWRILRKDGLLLVEVPGAYNWRNEYPGLLEYFVIAHFFHYTSIHLRQVLGKARFSILKCDETVTCLAAKGDKIETVDIGYESVMEMVSFLSKNHERHIKPNWSSARLRKDVKALLRRVPGLKRTHTAFKTIKGNIRQRLTRGLCKEGLGACRHTAFALDTIDCTDAERREVKRRLAFYVQPGVQLCSTDANLPCIPRLKFGPERRDAKDFDIDWRANPHDGWEWCRLTAYAYGHTPCIAKAQQRFKQATARLPRFQKAYAFGTGPSLADASGHDWSDGYRVVCNTIVRDLELWRHIDPHFIIAGDAIYHFGCDDFAIAFRNDLQDRLAEGSTIFLYPDCFDAIVRKTLDIDPERLVPVPSGSHKSIHERLQRRFSFPALGNVLPMLLTVACSLSKNIKLWGFDGKDPSASLFWKNSPKQHYPEHVAALQQAHPMFFSYYAPDDAPRKYTDMFQGRELDAALHAAEAHGFVFNMMHHSWTDILQKRTR